MAKSASDIEKGFEPSASHAEPDFFEEAHSMFERFLHSQVASSGVLVFFALLALIWANSPWSHQYFTLAKIELGFHIGELSYSHSLSHWIKDGLMAIFFFVVGLEIKRELVVGELSSPERAILPVSAAIGGALVPALIYAWFNASGPGAAGWGIPMATDIAFALGVLALFGSRVPIGLKVFLMALAIVDDLLAVLVIALFYTETLNLWAVSIALLLLGLLYAASQLRIRTYAIYLPLIFGVWVSVEASGIHATIAGVLVALLVPVRSAISPRTFFETVQCNLNALKEEELTSESINLNERQRKAVNEIYLAAEDMTPPGISLEKQLHSFQAFVILPLFALFAAGVTLDASTLQHFPGPIAWGVILGLFLGKPLGILLTSWLVVRSGAAALPKGVTWPQIGAASALAGIGFTMSIFIGDLAFSDPLLGSEGKIAVLLVSLAAGLFGAGLLHHILPR